MTTKQHLFNGYNAKNGGTCVILAFHGRERQVFWNLNCRNVAQKDTKWKEYRYLGISKKLLNEKILYVQTHYRQTY